MRHFKPHKMSVSVDSSSLDKVCRKLFQGREHTISIEQLADVARAPLQSKSISSALSAADASVAKNSHSRNNANEDVVDSAEEDASVASVASSVTQPLPPEVMAQLRVAMQRGLDPEDSESLPSSLASAASASVSAVDMTSRNNLAQQRGLFPNSIQIDAVQDTYE